MASMRKGIPKLFKDGYKQFSGVEEAILNNTAAVQQFADILKTSFGPNGMNKIVINHIEKVYVTSECATIVDQLQVEHPAANVVVHAAKMQEKEIGDGTNFVVIFAGELLKKAEELIGLGLHPSDIVTGYDKASRKALSIMNTLTVDVKYNIRNVDSLAQACRTAVASKCFGQEEFVSNLVAQSCLASLPENPLNFNIDNIRFCSILGSSVHQSYVMPGMVMLMGARSNTKKVEDCKVLIMTTNIGLREMDVTQNVLFENANDLLNFSKSEEEIVEAAVKKYYDMGVRMLIINSKPTDLEIHYLNKYKIYCLICISKWGRRRLGRVTGARICVTKDIKPEDLGHIKCCEEMEIGGRRVTRVLQREGDSPVSTIVIRAASKNIMNDIERACAHGINAIRALTRDASMLAGAGAVEIELARLIQEYGGSVSGLDQYAVKAFGEALEVFPRILARNSGMDFEDTIAKLYAEHSNGNVNVGVDVVNKNVMNAVEKNVLDLLVTKRFGMKLTINAVLTILRVDHIIMSKPAGGPKKPTRTGHWDDDDDAW